LKNETSDTCNEQAVQRANPHHGYFNDIRDSNVGTHFRLLSIGDYG